MRPPEAEQITGRVDEAEIATVREALRRDPLEGRVVTSVPYAAHIPADAFWNGIARAWFVELNGEAVRLDPQPAAPGAHGVPVSPRIDL